MSSSSEPRGRLLLVPVPLGDAPLELVLPAGALAQVRPLRHFLVENARTARRFLATYGMAAPIQALSLVELDKHGRDQDFAALLAPALGGQDMGILSEAGCPGVADPGSEAVMAAHAAGIEVVPLTGPSSLLLALMGSGMNGQSFAFHGYLPKERTERIARIRVLEDESRRLRRTQIFIETPYRNNALLADLIQSCRPPTRICIACDLTLSSQMIRTLPAGQWRAPLPDLSGRPTVFLLLA